MTTVRHIFLPQPRTSRATIGCPGCEEKSESLCGLDLRTAPLGNSEKVTDETESGKREKIRATG